MNAGEIGHAVWCDVVARVAQLVKQLFLDDVGMHAPAGTGGRVHSDVVKEQLLYELGDPRDYITPDCVADFTSIHLDDIGSDRVRVSGIRGRERPPTLKLSISYSNGWKAIGTLVYSWPLALAKAQAADRIVRQRLADLGLTFEEIYTEFLGVN